MFDPRMQKLAKNLIRYSCRLKKGEKILIEAIDIPDEMVALLIRETSSHALAFELQQQQKWKQKSTIRHNRLDTTSTSTPTCRPTR